MPHGRPALAVRVCRAADLPGNVCGYVPAAARRSTHAPVLPQPLALRAEVYQWLPRQERAAAMPRTALNCALYAAIGDRKSTRLNSSHTVISYAVFCLKKKKQ